MIFQTTIHFNNKGLDSKDELQLTKDGLHSLRG